MIIVKQICKSYGANQILDGISLSLKRGQKIALVGPNGVGKSTLLKIIAGKEKPDSGSIEYSEKICIGYLPQEFNISSPETIKQYLKKITGLDKIEAKLEELESNLDDQKNVEEYSRLLNLYTQKGGYDFEYKIEKILKGLGLEGLPPDTQIQKLSGGQKQKIALAGLLLLEADILLLDEPTNNLDLPALIWLENFIYRSKSAFLIVSHDRRFLDKTCNKVFEIDWQTKKLNIYTGSYSDYLREKEKYFQTQKKLYELQQEKIKRITNTIRDKEKWAKIGAKQKTKDHNKYSQGVRRDRSAKLAKSAKALEKRLKEIEIIEKPQERHPPFIDFIPKYQEKKFLIRLKRVIAGYKDSFKTQPINLDIEYGNRICIVGVNGSGKSTLLKTMIGELQPLQGEIIRNPTLIVGNLLQEHENLPRDISLLNFMKTKTELSEDLIYSLLRHFNFQPNQVKALIQTLSPGERARYILAYFSAIGANLLIMDEPSNHLDLDAIESLEEALKTYPGALVVVSHDRYFIEQVGFNYFYALHKGQLIFLPDFNKYLYNLELKLKLN